MDQRERYEDFQEALRTAIEGAQRSLWTALPGIIDSFNPADGTVSVVPAIKMKVRDQKGVETTVQLPLLIKCPIQSPSGGGFTTTFPIAKGDECLVVFASRCIDGWWQNGGVQAQMEYRLHHLSDGFCIPGIRSVPRALAGWSGTSAQMRKDDGTAFVEVDASSNVNVQSTGTISLTGYVKITGSLDVTGAIHAGYGGADQVGLQTHQHPTAATGAPSSPTAGT